MQTTMNYSEAAAYLKIVVSSLRGWVSKGKIPYHKAGRRVIFFQEELEAWLNRPAASSGQAAK